MNQSPTPTVPCRICSAGSTADDRGALECSRCRSVIVENVPTQQVLDAFYANYNDRYSGGGSSHGDNQVRYANAYLKLVKRFSGQGTLIDIGCANNPFPNLAYQHGFKTTAADFSKPPALDPHVEFRLGHLNSRSLLADATPFDIVTAWAVIEHVADPELAFQVLSGLVREGGTVFLTTPEIGTWLTHSAPGRTGWFYPPEHLHLLSPTAIKILSDRHDLELIEWGHFELNPVRWLARYGIGFAETVVGTILRKLAPLRWHTLRQARRQKFVGIAYYVLRRRASHPK